MLDVVADTEGDGTHSQVLVEEDGEVTEVSDEAQTEDIPTGASVEATVAAGEVVAATVTEEVAATVTIAAHHAYVVAIDDSSTTTDISLATAVADAQWGADYWVAESDGAISSFDIAGSTTLAMAGSCSQSASGLWSAAAAAYPGVSFTSGYNHLIVYTPSGCSYGYAGLATVGYMAAGGYVHIATVLESVVAHELGHNLGLGHSNLVVGNPASPTGTYEYYGAYGPQAAAIGAYAPGALDAAYRTFLDLPGIATQTQAVAVPTTGPATQTVSVVPTTTTSGTNALKIVDPSTGGSYFVEYRAGQGLDSSAFYANGYAHLMASSKNVTYEPGVVVTWMNGSNALRVIGTATSSSTLDSSFQPGDSYAEPTGLFSFTVTSATSSGATLNLTVGRPLGKASTSTLTASSPYEGSAGSVRVKVTSTVSVSGSVDLYIDGAFYATKAVSSSYATFSSPTTLGVGDHTLRAVYSGSSTVAGSEVSGTLTVKAKSSSAVTITSATAVVGTAGAVAVSVTSATTPSGTVMLYVDGVKVASKSLSSGKASLSTPSSLALGSHALRAVYVGSTSVAGSETTGTLTVSSTYTSATTISATSPYEGSSGVATVTVAQTAGTATGYVSLYVDGVKVTRKALSTGIAKFSLPRTLSVGSHALSAVYEGSAKAKASTGTGTMTVRAKKASSATVTAASVYEKSAGKAYVSVTSSVTASGYVYLYVDGVKRSSASLRSGSAALTIPSTLTVGTHALRVVYAGSTSVASTSVTGSVVVKARQATSVTASASTFTYGTSGKFVVTVTGPTTPSGTVTLRDGTYVRKVTLSSTTGKATITMPSTWARGTHSVTITYNGAKTLAPSSTTKTVTVN
ncbi:Ig-like domain repeat protein [Demequina salsinemoris]|uniref:Ig-like domain repeat protein n=1 Tax=Demequina salsinemoris TaxID=577470 RepID=UPI000784E7B9|nr:Ig-like domain repeat protein [Demequina salsinemoris]